ncbi:MAG: DUF4293 family protein [Bacteroidota bacterium]
MIQRIQSLYLLVGSLLVGALFALEAVWQTLASLPAARWAALALAGLTIVLGVVAIFRYQDRSQQRRLILFVQIGAILTMLALGGGLYLAGGTGVWIDTAGGADVVHVLGVALPIVAYLLFYLARRGVEKDIALVRSMDRLR